MEKPILSHNSKLRNKILKLFPKAISFKNLPFSPRRDSRSDVRPRPGHNKAFSGPIAPMIPAEARRKPKSFETQEPSSPKVSCTGRVNCKSKISKKAKKHVSLPREFKPVPLARPERAEPVEPAGAVKKKKAGIKRLLRKSREPAGRAEPVGESAPSLSHMRKFGSSRETFANFDWTTAQVAPEYCSDEEDGGGIAFSEPLFMMRGGGRGGDRGLELEPKKEINLWKRRTMAHQPREFKTVPLARPERAEPVEPTGPVKKKKAGIKRLLRKSREPAGRAEPVGESAPSLSHMRKFASSRETFANFDWTTAQVAPEYCSDEEDGGGIAFLEPLFMMRGGGRGGDRGLELEPKKEINLWKRRTMAHQPKSLELDFDE